MAGPRAAEVRARSLPNLLLRCRLLRAVVSGFSGFELLLLDAALQGRRRLRRDEARDGVQGVKDDIFGEWYSEVRWVLIRSFRSG